MEVTNPFEYIPGSDLTPVQQQTLTRLRSSFYELWCEVFALVPPGKARSVVQTHLETACMWAIKGVVFEGREP